MCVLLAQRNPGYKFDLTATATDSGADPKSDFIDLDIKVVESHKKAPAFIPPQMEPIKLVENYNNFDTSIVRLKAVSNVNSSKEEDSYLQFNIVTGRAELTNKGNIFRYLRIARFFVAFLFIVFHNYALLLAHFV